MDYELIAEIRSELKQCGSGKHIHRMAFYAKDLLAMLDELEEHCETFCKCPTHGPSLIQIPDGEFD